MTLKRFLIVLIVLPAIATGSYFAFRNQLLDYLVDKTRAKIHERYNAELVTGKTGFEGFARVRIQDISLISPEQDTLFYCNETAASFSLRRFLQGQPPVNNIVAGTGYLSIVEYSDSTANYSFLLNREVSDTTGEKNTSGSSYRDFVARTWNRFLGLTDFNILVSDFDLRWKAPGYNETVVINMLELQETEFR